MVFSLKNLTILITRPVHQALGLSERIEALGGHPILFPTIEILELEDKTQVHAQVEHLSDYHFAIFISANAAQKAAPIIQAHWPTWPTSTKIISIGASTAKALQVLNWPASIHPTTLFNSETLLTLPELQNIANKKIILFRGEGGRELLAKTLRERGTQLTEAIVYQRAQPQHHVLHQEKIDVIICTSNHGLQNLVAMTDETSRQWLQNMRLLVISDRMVHLAKELGFTHKPMVAKNASDAAIIETLTNWQRKI